MGFCLVVGALATKISSTSSHISHIIAYYVEFIHLYKLYTCNNFIDSALVKYRRNYQE